MNQFQNPYYQPRTNGIIWVQGIEGAKAYQLMPNSNAMLLDSDNDDKFYIKVSDNVGMCTLRSFEYKEITEQTKTQTIDTTNFVTKEDLEKTIKELKEKINEQIIQPAKQQQQLL